MTCVIVIARKSLIFVAIQKPVLANEVKQSSPCHCEKRSDEAIHCLTGLLRRYTPRNDMCFVLARKSLIFVAIQKPVIANEVKQSISPTGLLRRYTPRNDMCYCHCEKIFDFRGNPETCPCERSEAIQPMSLRETK